MSDRPRSRTNSLVPAAPDLGRHLEELSRSFHYESSIGVDPVAFVHRFSADPRAAEIMGIYASTIAVGNVLSIRRNLEELLRVMGGDPRGFVEGFPRRRWRTQLGAWKHRWIRAEQMGFLAVRLGEIYENYPGGLEEVFLDEQEGELTPDYFPRGLDALSRALRWGSTDLRHTFYEPPPGYLHLFPSPRGQGSAPVCKRLSLFARWMVRTGAPDLGLWKRVPPSILHVPLDTHVYWISYHIGLTRRKTRTWRTVEEITTALRRWDPVDPVRFDFALAHTGISGDCPKKPLLSVCGKCALRPDCDLWVRKAPRRAG